MREERKNPDYAKTHNTIIELAPEVIDVQKNTFMIDNDKNRRLSCLL